MTIQAYASREPGADLQPFEYEPSDLASDEVEISVEHCGICHSDLSMLNNDWGLTEYPFVPGHEVVGTIQRVGGDVTRLKLGQRVGLGWLAESCQTCRHCVEGDQNLCFSGIGTIVGRHGGFAERVRAKSHWVFPLPAELESKKIGPLFCGGITVFNPLIQQRVWPTDRVGVLGIGGLGHLALQFMNAWGCEVTAFSSTPDKEEEARQLGAHHFVNSRDSEALEDLEGSMDLILVTINVDLDWMPYIQALAPKGRLHFVGAAPEVSSEVFPLIAAQRSITASPIGSPSTIRKMLDFAARHDISPMTETFPLSQVNEAMEKLRTGSPRYRLILENDL